MNGTEWEVKEEKIPQDFLLALGPEATHQKTQSEFRTDLDNIKKAKIIKLYNSYYQPKRIKHNSRGDFFGQN